MESIYKIHLTDEVYGMRFMTGDITRQGTGDYLVRKQGGTVFEVPQEKVVAVEYTREERQAA